MKKEENGVKYWKSLDDLMATPGFNKWVEKEFPAGASELSGVNRRSFMKIMAASFGLAGLGMTGCRKPKQRILPYSKQPENLIPGIPNYYSTSFPGQISNIPLIVESHQGRPTKIEGNPSYKEFGGATNTFAQASILDLYDPDRATKSTLKKSKITTSQVKDLIISKKTRYTKNLGKGLAVLAEPSSSPTRLRLKKDFLKRYPLANWTEYSPSLYSNFNGASNFIFGESCRANFDFSKLDRILSIDNDFVAEGDNSISHSRGFSHKRKVLNKDSAHDMNRLYIVESTLTRTGSMADHRLRKSISEMQSIVASIAIHLTELSNLNTEILDSLKKFPTAKDLNSSWLIECAKDLYNYKGNSAVIIGEHLDPELHAMGIYINKLLLAPVEYYKTENYSFSLDKLVDEINNDEVETLLIFGGNPVFDAPDDYRWNEIQSGIKEVIHFSESFNETSDLAEYHIAKSHYLESWSDGRTNDGRLLPVQPLIEPLFETFDEIFLINLLVNNDLKDSYSLIQETYQSFGGLDFNKYLAEGLSELGNYDKIISELDMKLLISFLNKSSVNSPGLSINNLEVRFITSSHVFDGRYANNGWLLECPDPITKLTWDNALFISAKLAKELEENLNINIFASDKSMNKGGAFFKSVKGELQKNSAVFNRGKQHSPIVKLVVNNKDLELPLHVLPGLADYTIVLPFGMGRRVVGRVGENTGFNTYPLRKSHAMSSVNGAKILPCNERFYLANTQEHWSMEGRAIVREANVDYYKKNPDFANKMGVESHAPKNYGYDDDKSLKEKSLNQYRGNSSYPHPAFNQPDSNVKVWKGKEDQIIPKQQWGMAIDLNTCSGCSACIVACQSENNIPIVGKEQVLRGREMHWLRLDRYFSAKKYNASEIPDDVQVSFMSMACVHCENAPCESVCPVNATVHDKEGLNVMAYNRCVGTRYCANNCPYKVRRFNFFDWNKRKVGEFYKGPLGPVDEPELEKMMANPDVTVRMRGVMEKCTYCIQRIQEAKINQKVEVKGSRDTHVPDGTIKTACQQVCGNDSIQFGDISDPNSKVSKMKASDRNYSVLGYLNVRPRTTYLARLRNPNKRMPDYYKKPYAYSEYKERYGG